VQKFLRVTIGIGLLMTLVTACQSGQKQTQKPPDPSFKLSLDSTSLNLMQGDMSDVTINLERLNGFEDAVALSFKDLPADVTPSPALLTIPATASSLTVHLTASDAASIATGKVTVEGVSGALLESAALNLATIRPDPNRPDVFIKRIEWGQSVLKPDLRLVPGKSALLLAYINATRAGVSGIRVRATLTAKGSTLGTLDLTAPASIPTSDSATDLASTYWSILPKEWIRPGLEVKLEVDAGRSLKESNEANNTQLLQPTVGTGTKLFLTMVPLIADGKPALAFDAAAVAAMKTGLMSLWPLADIDIQVRAPYTVKSVSSDWGAVLREVTALRDADLSERYYYGFYAIGGGIGWVGNGVGVGVPSLGVVAHELGHNFGQWHAPCGNPSGVDADYPYKNGSIGSWGFDSGKKALVDPAKYMDVMGYCGTKWVSDFMYNRAQTFLESNVPSAVSVDAAATDLLLVNGTLENGQVRLEPLQRISGAVITPKAGPFRLTLETAFGIQQVSFDVRRVTHEDGTGRNFDKAQFSFTMPDPGRITKLTITQNDTVRFEQSPAGTLRSQSAPTNRQPITVQRSGSSLKVTWDAKVHSSVALAHIAPDGTRTMLALGLSGGTAVLEMGALGEGQFEVSASDGLNGIKQRF
jgi:Peptidase M66